MSLKLDRETLQTLRNLAFMNLLSLEVYALFIIIFSNRSFKRFELITYKLLPQKPKTIIITFTTIPRYSLRFNFITYLCNFY